MPEGILRLEVLNFRSPHRVHLFKCCMFTDSWCLCNSRSPVVYSCSSLNLFMLLCAYIFVFLPSTPSFPYLPKYVSHSLRYLLLFCTGDLKLQPALLLSFGRALPTLLFGWQMLSKDISPDCSTVSSITTIHPPAFFIPFFYTFSSSSSLI